MEAWLEAYANRLGEKMPHMDQIHLQHYLTKKAMYKLMSSEKYVDKQTQLAECYGQRNRLADVEGKWKDLQGAIRTTSEQSPKGRPKGNKVWLQ